MPDRAIELNGAVGDSIKTTTCYMCACRCGIKVHLKDGAVRYIEGNKDHPVNKGVMCGKGAAGIMKQLSPAKLRKPLLRVGERGKSEFREIEWDEALSLATGWLKRIRETDPKRLAFFTGRDQSQALTGWWAQMFGTPNYAAHGGFCSVNMAAAGLYTVGGSFWEFGEPDFDRTKMFVMFGVAEDHASNPIKIGIGKLKGRGAKFVSVNPVRTGYSAVADEWIGIRPGTDGLFVLSLVRELLLADRIDTDFLVRSTNAHWLVVRNPGGADDGLFARDEAGKPLAWDRGSDAAVDAGSSGISPMLMGERLLPDGRRAVPVFELMARKYMDAAYAPETVAPVCGVAPEAIRSLAAELARVAFEEAITLPVAWTDAFGNRHAEMIGRPVAFHAMRGISAHSNGFQTCRALHLLQMLLGAIDCPGAFRFKPPFPKPCPPGPPPAGPVQPGETLKGPPLGFPTGPEHLLVDEAGEALRIDGAYSWAAPIAAHGAMHMVIRNAHDGVPYPIDTLMMFMANMSWNSAMNTEETVDMLTAKDANGDYRIPRIIYSDAFFSEMVAYADLVLPDTTYLERHDCISLLDRPISDAEGAADSIRQPILAPDRDVRPFQDVLLDLGVRLGLPGMTKGDGSALYPGGLPDYLVNHERRPGVGMLAGFRGTDGTLSGKGAVNPKQLEAYIENGCFWKGEIPEEGRFFKHVNKAYLDWAVAMGFLEKPDPIVMQLYVEPLRKFQLAAEGHGPRLPPERFKARIKACLDPLPIWYAPFEGTEIDEAAYPLHALTQRPMIMYHAWDSQNAWQRQILSHNKLYLPRALARSLDISEGDKVWVIGARGRVQAEARPMEGVNAATVWTWNAVGKRAGAWALSPDAPEATRGFLLNPLIGEHLPDGETMNADPVTGQAAWYDLRVRIEKAVQDEIALRPSTLNLPPGLERGAA